ncbi:MAG: DoxX family protein, partial [Flavisolibacter sp.]|nr:DoxX family protein [Flavisolibacter sp.]
MNEYLKRDVINKLPVPEIFVYIGKGIELVGDIFLILGFLTRIATLIMALN